MSSTSAAFAMPLPFGIDATTGRPLDGIDAADLTALQAAPVETAIDLDYVRAKADLADAHFGVIGDVDPNQLDQAGWAVIFGPSADAAVRDALRPLLEHRRVQTGDELFRIFDGPTGYVPGDTAEDWLKGQGVRMDVVDPALGVPFYLLIVAPPNEIPYEFQYGLDLYWGVGRLWFEDADEFRQYADSVVRYEQATEVATSREAAIFATRHDFDAATQLFAGQVAEPLTAGTGPSGPLGKRQKFSLRSLIGDPATKAGLHGLLSGEGGRRPALLFTGGHGKAFRMNDPLQATSQGALICQDWSGYGTVGRGAYFDASDLGDDAKVHGLIHFMFACYGGGWPQFDNFSRAAKEPKQLAQSAGMARLPQALLSHKNGGALAILAHVDRAWAHSFSTGPNTQTQGFRDVMGRLMRGDRVGQATDQFNMRWAALSTDLAEVLDQMSRGLIVDPRRLATQWVARDDARNYVVFGDPAVRLRVEDMPATA